MVYVPITPQQKFTPPVPLNALDVARRLANMLPHEENFRASDAILLVVSVDAFGNVKRVRALPPTILGFIPRVMARVPPAWVAGRRKVRWAAAPNMLAMAAEVGRELVFEPARRGEDATGATCRVVLPLHLPEEAAPAY